MTAKPDAGDRWSGLRVAMRSAADPAHPLIASHEAGLRLRVLKAAGVLVDRLTYDAVTIDAVARASGVSKSTLYRYWPSRQLLVLEAFTYKTNLLTSVDDTGDVARDLHAYLVALTYCLKVGGAASTVANLLAEAIRSEEFAVQFRQTLLRERRQGFLEILLRGQRRGQIRDDVDLVMVIDAVYGAIHHRLIATGQDIDGAFLRHLTHFTIDGAANPASKTLRTNVGSKHPELYRAMTAVAVQTDKTALAEGLSPLLIELVKIRASQINGCAFCLRLHTKDSLAKGESPERLSVLPAWRESMYFDEQERSALALAEYITTIQDSHISTGLYESAVAHLTPGQVSAVTWLTMAINTYNRIAISGAYKVAP